MPQLKTQTAVKLTTQQALILKQRAISVLEQLVTPNGIFASTEQDWQGPFHAYYGRDTAITASLVMAAEELNGEAKFTPLLGQSLAALSQWQGAADNPATGEELGKLPHEIRTDFDTITKLQHAWAQAEQKPWFIDSRDGFLKSWDSADSTPLWTIATLQWHQAAASLSPEAIHQLRQALEWCLRNLQDGGGLAGFTSVEFQPGRQYGGLDNQSWKDSGHAYLLADGSRPPHPIYDVYVSAVMWAALRHGAVYFAEDKNFSGQLSETADKLKQRFNDPASGFLRRDESTKLWYYAEAIDGQGKQLPAVAADPGLALWANFNLESVIDSAYRRDVVKRVMQPDIFNPAAGIRTYSSRESVWDPQRYHRGRNVYWPFESALIARGLTRLGLKSEGRQVAAALLRGLSNFDTCVELFVEEPDGTFDLWRHPDLPQTSALNQAWTAAAIYYAVSLLEAN